MSMLRGVLASKKEVRIAILADLLCFSYRVLHEIYTFSLSLVSDLIVRGDDFYPRLTRPQWNR